MALVEVRTLLSAFVVSDALKLLAGRLVGRLLQLFPKVFQAKPAQRDNPFTDYRNNQWHNQCRWLQPPLGKKLASSAQ